MSPLSYINEIPLYPAWNPGAEDRRPVVNTACQLDRIQNHLEDKPLGISLMGFIDASYTNCRRHCLMASDPGEKGNVNAS